jgi:FkbM family methyltransferase
MRTLHTISAEPWLKRELDIFWGEWDHPLEASRSLQSLVMDLQLWRPFIKPGTSCIDIGAHSGDTAIPMGLFAYDTASDNRATVIAVEPNPDLHSLLATNLQLNSHIANFHLVKAAITSTDCDQIELADHGNANCNGGVVHGSCSEVVSQALSEIAGTRYFARGITLETLFREIPNLNPRTINFIKTDCEGYDKEILRSAKDVLSEIQPILFIEWFERFTPSDDQDLFNAIDEIHYVAKHPGSWHAMDPSSPRLSDILCVPKTRLSEFPPQ